ncbi:carbon-nitrogen hydrolase family protein [Paenibacillus filicis]|uniref:Carbon-nitrogen hydrolase family protein n=1 Tax=Paenibacillus gyeongsangnamensis TaxID=3388067 RepID=A0ABT4QDB4_9BACL|nr:carbon-nitrogen hydrolase family protein [Paenibacillus filicis]MCZ8514761.1 carbon-nitrogen hydrolase family protein [Paenibacillus filicis]
MGLIGKNLIKNNDFSEGVIGEIPSFWHVKSPRGNLAPHFELVKTESATQELMIYGNNNDNCVGCIYSSSFVLRAGRTYRMSAQFRISDEINPYKNLLFAFYSKDFNDGIFQFTSTTGLIEGENRFYIPGDGDITSEIRIYFKLSGHGKTWIQRISFEECESLPPRSVKVACVEGKTSFANWEKVLDVVGREKVDLVLLPETFRSTDTSQSEPIDGPSAQLMSSKARQYQMHVAGTFYHLDQTDGNLYNTGLIFDRKGNLLGKYDKNHPFSPELLDRGVTPGTEVPVFPTDIGKIGMMICYDSWFTDIAELLALKGAEIVLFPSAGYYQSIMTARASDNCIRIMASSLGSPLGIWDTSGAEVQNPNADPTRHSNCDTTFHNVYHLEEAGIKILLATLDLNKSPSPHNWGGPMRSAPGGRRNRREQKELLFNEIQREIENPTRRK